MFRIWDRGFRVKGCEGLVYGFAYQGLGVLGFRGLDLGV